MPPPIITPAFLASLRAQPHLPRHCWYFVAGVTLAALNRPEEIGAVMASALAGAEEGEKGTGNGDEEAPLTVARKMREALVKAAVVGGLPKVRCVWVGDTATCSALPAPRSSITSMSPSWLGGVGRIELLGSGRDRRNAC